MHDGKEIVIGVIAGFALGVFIGWIVTRNTYMDDCLTAGTLRIGDSAFSCAPLTPPQRG